MRIVTSPGLKLTITARWSAVSPETIEHRSRSTREHPFTSSVNSRSALFFLLRRMIACIGESPSSLGAFRSASLLLMCFNRVCGCVCVLVYRPELKTHTLAHHTHTHTLNVSMSQISRFTTLQLHLREASSMMHFNIISMHTHLRVFWVVEGIFRLLL